MKKIYVLTFHGSVNYGAVLQAYALNRAIEDLGYTCEVIDYNRELHHRNYLRVIKSSIKGLAYQILQYPEKYRLHKKFDYFTKTRMNIGKKIYNGFYVLKNAGFETDATYIVGSDQVWNCELTEDNLHYYLDFVESRYKYSYAASFGVSDISDWKNKETVLELLKKFRRISVREESGQKILKKHLGTMPEVVCDPTFLIMQEQWAELASEEKKDQYILLFMLARDEKLIRCAKEMALKNDLKIINIVYSVKRINGIEDVCSVGPEEWLAYIKDAKYIFTNSFHGFAFALNFNKQVWVSLSSGGRNSRILDIAKRYDVENRIVGDVLCEDEMDYAVINQKVGQDRKLSLQYLEEILNESN